MTESQLRTVFTQIADGELPPSRVDTGLAHRRGRTRLRWRRACVAGAPVLAAATAVAVILTVGIIPGRSGPGRAADAAPQRFDPLVPYLSFGWLPPGESLVGGGTGQAVMYLTAAPKPGNYAAAWSLSVYAAGQCARAATKLTCSPIAGEAPTGSIVNPGMTITGRAPSVHGHRAFWARGGLVWQYARGGWALLYLPYPFDLPPKVAERVKPGASLAAAERDAVKVASHVAFGAATAPLLFPVQLTGLPRQWQVSGATYVPDGSVLRVRTFALNAGPAAGARDYDGGLTFQNNLPWFDIDPVSAQHNPCSASRKSVREVINGYHVIVNHEPGARALVGNSVGPPNQNLCAANADGLALYISEYVPHLVISVESLFSDHLRLLGGDPAHWTNKPLR